MRRRIFNFTATAIAVVVGWGCAERGPVSAAPAESTAGAAEAARGRTSLPWPQFRGPARDNVSPETGLLQAWESAGPPLAWTAAGLGEGYSSVSLGHGLVFTMGTRDGREVIIALSADDGREVWTAESGPLYKDGTGNGPRGTPTLDGENLYALGASGDLTCVNARSGKIQWQQNILKEFQGRNITWGISESVLIDGDKLICTPGGSAATMVALDKRTGRPIWKAKVPGNPKASYASPIAIDVQGVRQYVTFTSSATVGVRAEDGEFLWQDTSSANGTANCSTPLFHDGQVFSASGYGTGGALLRLASDDGRTTATRAYHTGKMKNHHGGMVVVDGYLYGSSDPGVLTCIELSSGDVLWTDRSVGKGSVTYADGRLYVRSENGPVALVEATPEEYRELGRFDQPQRSSRPAWSHPVVADGKLFLRDMERLLCYDVRAR